MPQVALEVSTTQAHSEGLSGEKYHKAVIVAFCLLFKSCDCLSLLLLSLASWAALGCFLHMQAREGWKGGRQGQTRWHLFTTCNTCLAPQCWGAELLFWQQWDHWVKLGPQAIPRETTSAKAACAPGRSQSALCYTGRVDSVSEKVEFFQPLLTAREGSFMSALAGQAPSISLRCGLVCPPHSLPQEEAVEVM